MNGIEKITARIEADAVAEAARTAKEAAERCAKIRADYEKQAQEHYWTRAKQGVKATEDRVQRLAKTADMEARKSVLAFKQEVVAQVFDRTMQKILSMDRAKYTEFLAAKASDASATGTEEIILNAADKKACGVQVVAAANQKLTAAGKKNSLILASETGEFQAGLILREGNVSVNCTAEALVEQARSELASEVAVVLFS